MASLAAAQAAKASLQQKLQGQPWFRGVDFVQLKCICPDPYELQVVVSTKAALDELLSCPWTPRVWMGVPFSFALDVTAGFGDVTVTGQDYANVFIGFAVLFGTFMVGKIAVESIIESRREHFDAKGQPPEAVKAKETTMDGLVKFGALALSLFELSQEFPGLVTEAKRYLP